MLLFRKSRFVSLLICLVSRFLGISLPNTYNANSRAYSCTILSPSRSISRHIDSAENISLALQNSVLIVLAWRFSASTNLPVKNNEKTLVVLVFVIYLIGILNFLPEEHRHLLMGSTWPIMLFSRGSQVLATFAAGHTGSLSIITISMNLAGVIVRIFTTIKETGDMAVISSYLLSLSLGLTMFVQYWMYLSKTTEILKLAEASKMTKKEE